MTNITPLGALAASTIGTAAFAATELQLDINSLRAQALDSAANETAFGGLNHTGSIQLSANSLTELAGVLLDGVLQGDTFGLLASLSGSIELVNGNVVGGGLSLTLNNGDTFTAEIPDGPGRVRFQAGEGFSIDGLLADVTFSGPTFGGIDVSPWYDTQPVLGSFITFAFDPDDTGRSENTSTDVFLNAVVIPSPLAGGIASAGLLGLAARRRRA